MHWLRPLITALVLLAGFFAALSAQGQSAALDSTLVRQFGVDQEAPSGLSAACANAVACTGDVRVQAEAGLSGDRMVFGPTTGLMLSGRYRWLQLGLTYAHSQAIEGRGVDQRFPEEESVERYADTLGGQFGVVHKALGLRWEAALTGGVRTLYYREPGAAPGSRLEADPALVLGALGALGYELAPTSTRHVLIGLALSAGSNLTRGRHTPVGASGWAPRGAAMLTLGYVLDI